jgi:hypothetical protein
MQIAAGGTGGLWRHHESDGKDPAAVALGRKGGKAGAEEMNREKGCAGTPEITVFTICYCYSYIFGYICR